MLNFQRWSFSVDSAMNFEPGDILGGKYKILDALGGGAMGKLYKAENISIHKPLAIKVMQGDFAHKEEYRLRFMREAKSAAALDHLNICTIIDYDTTEEGDAYIVMELLSGETLTERIKRSGSINPLSACIIMRQLMSALACAHEKGVVHRDIKPDNIYLVKHDDRDDFVKLIDFGIAHITSDKKSNDENDKDNPQNKPSKDDDDDDDDEPVTHVGQVYGTPQYLAPEQANGEAVDYRSDLYAAGTVFYEMLVGETPFTGRSSLEIMLKQVNEPAPHLPDTIAQYERFDAIIQKLQKKKPEDRYASAQDVIPLLNEIILLLSSTDPIKTAANLAAITSSMSINLKNMTLGEASMEGSIPLSGDAQKNNYKRLFVLIGILLTLVAVLLVVHTIGLFHLFDHVNKRTDAVQEIIAADNVEPTIPPEPYIIDNENFDVSADKVLSIDTAITLASNAFLQENYEDAFNTLKEVKSNYWNHPNYLRLYMMASAAVDSKNHEIAAFAHLLALEPKACFNPAVKQLSDKLFDEDEEDELGNIIIQGQGVHSKTAMAWLIIHSNYDSDEDRLLKMLDVFDRLNYVQSSSSGKAIQMPKWLMRAINVWRLGKRDCQQRLRLLAKISRNPDTQEDVFQYILLPFYNNHSKNCSVRRNITDCNACLRPWLDEVMKYRGAGNPGIVLPDLDELDDDDDDLEDEDEIKVPEASENNAVNNDDNSANNDDNSVNNDDNSANDDNNSVNNDDNPVNNDDNPVNNDDNSVNNDDNSANNDDNSANNDDNPVNNEDNPIPAP